MKLVVGLGNPGKEYAKTRHNMGFMIADEFIKTNNLPSFKKTEKLKAEISEGIIEGEKVIVCKPSTYMNNSGEAVQKISQFYKINPADIYVVYDDLDLPLGQIRLRKEGGAGTHNGMKSVVEQLGTTQFPRLRIGIECRGESSPKQQETVSFVLSEFNETQQEELKTALNKANNALNLAINDFEKAMNQYNA